jgi:hypothetical protein
VPRPVDPPARRGSPSPRSATVQAPSRRPARRGRKKKPMAPPREALHKFTASPLALPLTLALLLAAGLTALAYPLYRSDPDFRLLQPPKGN